MTFRNGIENAFGGVEKCGRREYADQIVVTAYSNCLGRLQLKIRYVSLLNLVQGFMYPVSIGLCMRGPC